MVHVHVEFLDEYLIDTLLRKNCEILCILQFLNMYNNKMDACEI